MDTESNIKTHKYYFSDINKIILDTTQSNTTNKPQIRIINAGCFEVAEKFNYKEVVVHNFANNNHPGGPCSKFTKEGIFISNQQWANTQEDQLVKRYRENILLPHAFYPICEDNNPGNEALLYSECSSNSVLCDVITIPALQDPNYMKSSQYQTMVNRIKLILAICAKYNKILITGLWGCGAFGGNPKDLADLWQEALSDSRVPKPLLIIFAIKIDGASSKWGSFEDMEKLFKI